MTANPALDPMTLGDGVGRAAMIGASIGFFVMGGVASSIGLFAGLEPRSSVGIGAFVGVWGGPGFGAMFGAIRAITRNERAARLTPGDLDPI
jgi:hypothetical protein